MLAGVARRAGHELHAHGRVAAVVARSQFHPQRRRLRRDRRPPAAGAGRRSCSPWSTCSSGVQLPADPAARRRRAARAGAPARVAPGLVPVPAVRDPRALRCSCSGPACSVICSSRSSTTSIASSSDDARRSSRAPVRRTSLRARPLDDADLAFVPRLAASGGARRAGSGSDRADRAEAVATGRARPLRIARTRGGRPELDRGGAAARRRQGGDRSRHDRAVAGRPSWPGWRGRAPGPELVRARIGRYVEPRRAGLGPAPGRRAPGPRQWRGPGPPSTAALAADRDPARICEILATGRRRTRPGGELRRRSAPIHGTCGTRPIPTSCASDVQSHRGSRSGRSERGGPRRARMRRDQPSGADHRRRSRGKAMLVIACWSSRSVRGPCWASHATRRCVRHRSHGWIYHVRGDVDQRQHRPRPRDRAAASTTGQYVATKAGIRR